MYEPNLVGDHLGLTIDLTMDEFRALTDKLHALARQASGLLARAAKERRWLPVQQLASFAEKAQFPDLAIAPACFFLRELHCVHATRTS
jgi:hypothetical protein